MIKLRDLLKEKFSDAAFHGYKMSPADMRTSTCSTEWINPNQETGCPKFSDNNSITPEDETKAIDYLNKEDIQMLIAYSRGAAVLLQALKSGAKKPGSVVLVAPAWNRQWSGGKLSGSEASGLNGSIVHGGKDDAVPLKHSVLLSQKSGLPLYVVSDANHINILKYKQSPSSGKQIKDLDTALKVLPDWGQAGTASAEDLQKQIDFVNSIQ